MKIGSVKKQPNEKRRYGVDYTEALDDADVIQSVSAVVSPSGMTVAANNTDYFVNIVCTGGTDGVKYKVTLTVTTTDSHEIIEDEFYVTVKEI